MKVMKQTATLQNTAQQRAFGNENEETLQCNRQQQDVLICCIAVGFFCFRFAKLIITL